MNDMLLSDEQIQDVIGNVTVATLTHCKTGNPFTDSKETVKRYHRAIAKAQLIKDYEYWTGKCDKHRGLLGWFESHRYLCPQCRAEFEAEYKRLKEGKE